MFYVEFLCIIHVLDAAFGESKAKACKLKF